MEYYFPIIYGCESEREIDKVRETCYDMLKEYQMKLKSNEEVGSSRANSSRGHAEVTVEGRDPLSKFDMFVTHRTSKTIHVKSELDHYLEESVLPRTPYFDVLSWWKTNGLKYPAFHLMARDILAIPVSMVASESAFSTIGMVITPYRSRLTHDTLEALMCAQNWLRNEIEGNNLNI